MEAHPRLRHLLNISPMGKSIATFDWSKTSLGNPSHWPSSLVTALGIVLENKIAMYLLWGPDLIQFYNQAYAEILGTKHPAALGSKSITTWPEIWDTIHPLFMQVFTGKTVHYENMPLSVNTDGVLKERFYTFSFCPIYLEDGSVGGILDTVIDTTLELTHKKALEESEEKFRTYQEASPSPFFSLNTQWVVSYMNPAAFEILNISKEEVVGKILWEVFPNTEDTIFGDAYRRAMKGEKMSFEGYYPNYDRWYRVLAYNLTPGIAVSFQDITETKKLEQKLSMAVKARDEFLSIASHELKTPLTSLKLQSQMLNRDLSKKGSQVGPEKIQKFFEQTDKLVSRLNRLVDDMLDVSRIGSGKLVFEKIEADFKQILIDTIERMQQQFEGSPSGLPRVIYEGTDYFGTWDTFRIEQVINNLFTNALRYGEGKPIEVSLKETKNDVTLLVKDLGKGIPRADLDIIFEQFVRAENTEKTQGLGLGLHISKQIVEGHGGTISVESELGKGSTFKVILPKTLK